MYDATSHTVDVVGDFAQVGRAALYCSLGGMARLFLAGAAQQAQDALSRIQEIDEPRARWRGQLARVPSRVPEQAIDLFVENPFWTVNRLAARLGVALTTAQRAIGRLAATGIVVPASPAKRNRVYCAREILRILERDVA